MADDIFAAGDELEFNEPSEVAESKATTVLK